MLVLRKKTEGIWVKHIYRGAEIELKIRPANPDVFEKIRTRHRKSSYAKDPDTRQMVQVKEIDRDNVAEDTIDYLIEDFKGIGYSPSEPLAVTKENKILLVFLAPTGNEPRLFEWILETANELRTLSEQEIKELEKNL